MQRSVRLCAAWRIAHSGFSHADAEARRSVLTALACATLVTQEREVMRGLKVF